MSTKFCRNDRHLRNGQSKIASKGASKRRGLKSGSHQNKYFIDCWSWMPGADLDKRSSGRG